MGSPSAMLFLLQYAINRIFCVLTGKKPAVEIVPNSFGENTAVRRLVQAVGKKTCQSARNPTQMH